MNRQTGDVNMIENDMVDLIGNCLSIEPDASCRICSRDTVPQAASLSCQGAEKHCASSLGSVHILFDNPESDWGHITRMKDRLSRGEETI